MEKINNIILIIIIIIVLYIIYNIFFYTKINNNNHCNIDTFINSNTEVPIESNTDSNIIIYNFSSTSCGYCKQFQPIWDEFTKNIKNYKNINSYDIKCDKIENNDICNKYNINGYPTVLFKTNNNIIMYEGDRTVEALHNVLSNIYQKNTQIEHPNTNNKNIQLKQNKIIIYNFNTDWCGYSKKFEPIWNDFVLSLSDNELNKIQPINVKCDIEENKDLCNKYDIPGYPFVMIIDNDHIIPYSGPRTVEGLRTALNLNNKITNDNKTNIYNFNTLWCNYSKQFQPLWDIFANSLSEKEKINYNVIDVKCDNANNKELCKKYNIKGYPSVLIVNNTNIKEYNGPRTFEGLRSIITTKKIKIYNFNTSWCSYSIQFQPIWNTFYNSIKINDNVEAYDIKCDNNNKDLCIKFNIAGYPTVIIDNGTNITKYNGPMTLEGLKKAVNL